jgi:hypothetical protein
MWLIKTGKENLEGRLPVFDENQNYCMNKKEIESIVANVWILGYECFFILDYCCKQGIRNRYKNLIYIVLRVSLGG